MKKFDWDDFKYWRGVAVHISTEKQLKIFTTLALENRLQSNSDTHLDESYAKGFDYYKENTLLFSDGSYSNFVDRGVDKIIVLEFSDYFEEVTIMEGIKNEFDDMFKKACEALGNGLKQYGEERVKNDPPIIWLTSSWYNRNGIFNSEAFNAPSYMTAFKLDEDEYKNWVPIMYNHNMFDTYYKLMRNEQEQKTIVVLVGPSCAGKTTIEKDLCKIYGFHRIVSFTNRKQRDGEVHGDDYFFFSKDHARKIIEDGLVLEYEYYSQDRIYGTLKNEFKYQNLEDVNVITATPNGMRAIKEYVDNSKDNIRAVTVFLDCDLGTRMKRYIDRCGRNFNFDDKNEISSRVERDYGMFLNVPGQCDLVFDSSVSDTHSITNYISEFCWEGMKNK